MQLVILAGGKGSRMKELGLENPKPMFVIGGKPILERKIETLPDEIEEVIIVVGHLKDKIISYIGDNFAGRKITYVEVVPRGTGDALWQTRGYLHGEFMVMMGDDIYGIDDVTEVMKYPWAMGTSEVAGFASAADIEVDDQGYFTKAVFDYEGIKEKVMLDIGLYKFQKSIFDEPLVQLKNGEYGLPHTLFKYIERTGTKLYVHKAKHWLKINNPGDVEKAENYYKNVTRD
jgi:NDP-sugar pyrophosphorylase family protein